MSEPVFKSHSVPGDREPLLLGHSQEILSDRPSGLCKDRPSPRLKERSDRLQKAGKALPLVGDIGANDEIESACKTLSAAPVEAAEANSREGFVIEVRSGVGSGEGEGVIVIVGQKNARSALRRRDAGEPQTTAQLEHRLSEQSPPLPQLLSQRKGRGPEVGPVRQAFVGGKLFGGDRVHEPVRVAHGEDRPCEHSGADRLAHHIEACANFWGQDLCGRQGQKRKARPIWKTMPSVSTRDLNGTVETLTATPLDSRLLWVKALTDWN